MKRIGIFLLTIIMFICFTLSDPYVSNAYTFKKVYRVALRVHLGKSARPLNEWPPILEEINHIWLSQAGICFEMEVVLHDDVMNEGMDIWFIPGKSEIFNGMFRDGHDIWTKDTPDLRPARDPAQYPAARTAAHELGHGLGLVHNGGSDNNLMQSQTYGWKLDEHEAVIARTNAELMAYPDHDGQRCGPPGISRK